MITRVAGPQLDVAAAFGAQLADMAHEGIRSGVILGMAGKGPSDQ